MVRNKNNINPLNFRAVLVDIGPEICTMLIDCRKNLSQSDLTDCKIITIEGEEKVFLVGCLDRCHCFEIQ
jgi:hypothetical protein